MTISRPAQGGGVTAAEVNLKFVWDVVSRIKVGKAGLAYVVDASGSLIAHPDISLVLKKSNLMTLPQVSTMSKEPGASIGRDQFDQEVLSAHAPIPTLNWMVFVETPRSEMFEALYAPMLRAVLLLIAGLAISIVVAYLLVRALVRPLLALQEGAARIGAGEFDRRIEMNTGDELDDLAGQFNQMGSELKASYAGLERKVAERTLALQHEQLRTKELLHNILPVEIAEELSATGGARSARHESVTILFTDFSGFTQAVSTMPADRMVAELNEIFAAFDDITDEYGVEKIKTIGDAYMAAAGLPRPCADHGQRCIRAGLRMVAYLEHRNRSAAFKWSIRVGVHSGPVVAGVVGKRKYAFDIWGDTVNVASRMESAGEVGRVNISAYTYDLIQKDFECEYRGKVSAKGKGEIDMYFVKEPKSD
jgi:class 3 adenylate cyclase